MRPPGHASRVVLALVAGVAAAVIADYLVLRLMIGKGLGNVVAAGEGGKVWLLLGAIGLVVGSSAYSFTFKALDRRARRIHEETRIPRAKVQ